MSAIATKRPKAKGEPAMIRAVLLGMLVVGPTIIVRGDSRAVTCTFSNPRYAGKCVEQATPAERQTPVQACLAILECLNDARCVKSYCTATTIRGGWSLDSPRAGNDTSTGRPPAYRVRFGALRDSASEPCNTALSTPREPHVRDRTRATPSASSTGSAALIGVATEIVGRP